MDKTSDKRVTTAKPWTKRQKKKQPPLFPGSPTVCSYGRPRGCMCGVCCPALALEHYAAELVARDRAEIDALHVGSALDSFLTVELYRRMALRREAEAIAAGLEVMGFVLFVDHGSLRVEPADNLTPQIRSLLLTQPLREHLENICDERNDQTQSAHGGQNQNLPALPTGESE